MNISYLTPTFRLLITNLTLALFVAGCENRNSVSPPAESANASSIASVPATDKWLGKWIGPEGTFLQLAGGNGKYDIIIQNLDGPRAFQGIAKGDQIEFERHGVTESIRATNGVETGMKWLTEKSNCLTVRASEGYCRD